MKTKVSIINLGCARNLVDSETLLYKIKESDFELVESVEKADIGIINTCAFIDDAKKESIDIIFQAVGLKKDKNLSYLVVVGCMTQRYPKKLSHEIEEIDALISPIYYEEIDKILEEVIQDKKVCKIGRPGVKNEFFGKRVPLSPRSFTYLKISEGCNNQCSYCAIPFIRGEYTTRGRKSLLEEVEFIHSKAPQVKEFNLVGQDTTLYNDGGDYLLEDLIKDISNYDFVDWIRILYTHPEHYRDALIDKIADNPKVCRYVDLPIQHASNKILELMDRDIRKEDILSLVEKIRNKIPKVTLRTTLMVGFPQEEEEDFMELVDLMKQIKFEKLGIFTYSKEKGTKAYNFSGEVPQDEKERRFEYLMNLQEEISKNKLEKFIGEEIKVLIDEVQGTHTIGRTEFDAPEVDGQVFIESGNFEIGDLERVKIIDTLEYDLLAKEI